MSDIPVSNHEDLRKQERALRIRNLKKNFSLFFGNKRAVFGVCLLVFFLLVAFVGPLVYEYDHEGYFLGPRIGKPDEQFKLGFDELGRDVFGAIVYGTRASLAIGIFVALIVVVIGTAIGIAAGYYGGVIDIILMRVTEVFMLIPSLPLILTFAAIMGQSFTNIIIILGITSWTSTAARAAAILRVVWISSPEGRATPLG